MKGFLSIVVLCATVCGPALAQDVGYRALNFELMDINGDDFVDRNEWIKYYKDDIEQRDLLHPKAESLSFTIQTPEGPKVVYFKPVNLPETKLGVSAEDLSKQIREERAERESPAGQARRLRQFSGGSRGVMPSFEGFDENGDQKIARDEMRRQIPFVPERARN